MKMVPIRILELEENGFLFKTEVLREVLRRAPADSPIAILSIIGPTREEKSYVLNSFRRFFLHHSKENGLETSSADSFHCRQAIVGITHGIHIWPEPLIYQADKTSRKIAVFLLDCQGYVDAEITEHQNTVIHGVTSLLSSMMIHNVKGRISEGILQHMMPSITILVRDFQNQTQFAWGYHSSTAQPEQTTTHYQGNYYHSVFNTTDDMSRQQKEIRHNIEKTYRSVGVHLFPSPGKDFLEGMNPTPRPIFQSEVSELVFNSVRNLVAKELWGKELNCHNFSSIVHSWRLLNWDSMPQALSFTDELSFYYAIDFFEQNMRKFLNSYVISIPSKYLNCILDIYVHMTQCVYWLKVEGIENSDAIHSRLKELDQVCKIHFQVICAPVNAMEIYNLYSFVDSVLSFVKGIWVIPEILRLKRASNLSDMVSKLSLWNQPGQFRAWVPLTKINCDETLTAMKLSMEKSWEIIRLASFGTVRRRVIIDESLISVTLIIEKIEKLVRFVLQKIVDHDFPTQVAYLSEFNNYILPVLQGAWNSLNKFEELSRKENIINLLSLFLTSRNLIDNIILTLEWIRDLAEGGWRKLSASGTAEKSLAEYKALLVSLATVFHERVSTDYKTFLHVAQTVDKI